MRWTWGEPVIPEGPRSTLTLSTCQEGGVTVLKRVPPAMETTNQLPEDFDRMDADYDTFKAYVLQKHS